MSDWLAMDGYAAFVWPSYALTAAVIGVLVWRALALRAAARRRLKRAERRLQEAAS